jgi:hypothetical protein
MERDNVGIGAAPVATGTNSPDLEVKDAQLIFGAVWRELEGLFGRSAMRFPRELILLGGALGAGKGTNSDFIRKVRSIDAPPIVISQLLDTPPRDRRPPRLGASAPLHLKNAATLPPSTVVTSPVVFKANA